MHYYDRHTSAFGRWYDWLGVLLALLVAWLIGQFALTSPFATILANIDPEAAARSQELMLAAATENTAKVGLLGLGVLLVLLGAALGGIALLVHYLGARGAGSRVTMVVGTLILLVGLFPLFIGNGALADANAVMMSVIGLSPLAYALMLLTFPAALAGLYFGWKLIFERDLTSLHTVFERVSWGRILQSFAITWIVLGGFSFVARALGLSEPAFVFDASRFATFAVLSLLLLPIQSATEEIVVRGFMNRGLIRFLGNKWVAFTLTSALFMALHLANPEARAGAEAGILPIVMSGYFFFGFAACLMVLIDDGLESAIGVHAANNTFAAIFVNYENSALPTPSVWQVPQEPTGDAISVIIVLSIILGLLWVTRKPWLERRRALDTAYTPSA